MNIFTRAVVTVVAVATVATGVPATAAQPAPGEWEPCFFNGVRWNVPCVHDARHPLSTGGDLISAHRFRKSFKMFAGEDGYVRIVSLRHRRAHRLLGLG